MTLVLFLFICFIAYVCFVNYNYSEGFTDASGNRRTSTSSSSSSSTNSGPNGIAGNASTYAANLKATSVKLADTLLITKYRSDYESAIMNAEELVNHLMLQTTLSINTAKPQETIEKLVALHRAQAALNAVMKFVDSS